MVKEFNNKDNINVGTVGGNHNMGRNELLGEGLHPPSAFLI